MENKRSLTVYGRYPIWRKKRGNHCEVPISTSIQPLKKKPADNHGLVCNVIAELQDADDQPLEVETFRVGD